MFTLDYRPKCFSQMVGQKGIIKEMKEYSKNNSFPQVMLFEGPSGCGKTTLANIVSALIVDDNPIEKRDGSKDPNTESDSVKAIFSGKYNRDVTFRDASAMSKQDVLNLSDELALAPRFDSKKVFIIDEAQNLGSIAKGAMLTLLEKKRPDTYLILCTMDINAFDKAIISRCAHYIFKSPSISELEDYLVDFMGNLPDITLTDDIKTFIREGIPLIAENCEGSVRTALLNLERCLNGSFFTASQIESEFGIVSNEKLSAIINKLINRDNTVFSDIKNFSSKEFFYKLQKTLIDSYIYLESGYIDQEWKKYTAEKLKEFDLNDIIKSFSNVDANGYFKENMFFFDLAKGFFYTPY